MADRDDFLGWVMTALYETGLALHNGDAGPRRALWSRNEPVSILGASRNAYGHREIDELFSFLERTFSNCTSYAFELQAYDVVGDMAYTAGLEHTSCTIDGQPGGYTLRATQVYRLEDGEWKVAHRHGDFVIGALETDERHGKHGTDIGTQRQDPAQFGGHPSVVGGGVDEAGAASSRR